MGNRAAAFTGGSGAGYHGIIKIDNTVTANVVVGSAGVGYTRDINQTPPDSTPGDATTFSINNQTLISAGGGGGAKSWQSGGSIGTGGIINVTDIEEIETYFKTNGNNGNSKTSSSGISSAGAASVYSGHTYGASGDAHGDPGGGRGYPSKHGYVLIKYLGPTVTYTINPTPSDATVVLTANGYTQVGNSITVLIGTTIHYEVSKEGYITQSNDVVVSNNMIVNIILVAEGG